MLQIGTRCFFRFGVTHRRISHTLHNHMLTIHYHTYTRRTCFPWEKKNLLRMDRWRGHLRAGRFPQEQDKRYIDKKTSQLAQKWKTLVWRRKGHHSCKGLVTNGLENMAGLSDNDKCRFCKDAVESTSHLICFYTARHIYTYKTWILSVGLSVCSRFSQPPKVPASWNFGSRRHLGLVGTWRSPIFEILIFTDSRGIFRVF